MTPEESNLLDTIQPPLDADNFEPAVSPADNPYKDFEACVVKRVGEIFGPAGVQPDLIEIFAPTFAMRLDQCLHKFARGQLEHGGDIRDRDMIPNLWGEVMDTMIYLMINDIKTSSTLAINI